MSTFQKVFHKPPAELYNQMLGFVNEIFEHSTFLQSNLNSLDFYANFKIWLPWVRCSTKLKLHYFQTCHLPTWSLLCRRSTLQSNFDKFRYLLTAAECCNVILVIQVLQKSRCENFKKSILL